MAKKMSATVVDHCGVLYYFATAEAATDFEKCVNGVSGKPGECAQRFNCVRKEQPQRNHGLEM